MEASFARFLFSHSTPSDDLRAGYQKGIKKAILSIERETTRLEQQLAQLKAKVLKVAKEKGNTPELRQNVKDYLRTDKSINKFYNLRSTLLGVQVTMETTKATISLQEGLKNATRAMREMNQSTNIRELQAIMQEFGEGVGEAEQLQGEMGVRCFLAIESLCSRFPSPLPCHTRIRNTQGTTKSIVLVGAQLTPPPPPFCHAQCRRPLTVS
jgi:hypothetical protein